MRTSAWVRQLPLRLTAGAFILNSGLSKRQPEDGTAAALHGMAVGTYPFLKNLKAADFVKLLSAAEISLGTLLLVPAVPAAAAGGALLAFSGGLVGLYLRTPGMRQPGSVRPTQQGIVLAKDFWLTGIGASLLLEGLQPTEEDTRQGRARRQPARSARSARLGAGRSRAHR